MPIPCTDLLRIFILNVGQADTSVIVTPAGNVVLIDVVNARKVAGLLQSLGLLDGECISCLVITHPHSDHYSGAGAIVSKHPPRHVLLASPTHCTGTPGYHALINKVEEMRVLPMFVAGCTTIQPDGGFPERTGPVFRILGPTENMIQRLAEAKAVTPNHLSLITKMNFGEFVMVSAGDAQMENWAYFDQEGLMPGSCDLVKAAHHGSRHGTQCERLERLNPKFCVVSSDPNGRHKLPDLIGAATFHVHANSRCSAVLTCDSGTVEVRVGKAGTCTAVHYSEAADSEILFATEQPLLAVSNLTDWKALVRRRLDEP